MTDSDHGDHGKPDAGREHLEVLAETIDRNSDRDWAAYRERFGFRLVGDGTVCVERKSEGGEPAHPFNGGDEHVVSLIDGRAVECNCYVARRFDGRRFGGRSCRHMRAVAAHPQL